ncbi:MAG: chromate transporter [Clostridia bacterium]|nr:chromate transporter [Clostridia bacterium]
MNTQNKKISLLKLFFIFFKIGLFTFGGGYAMIPVIKREAVDNNQLLTEEEMLNFIPVSQCTPGVLAVNLSTFVGKKSRGFFGALFSTLGVITPSIIIISLVAFIFDKFKGNKYVIYAFNAIRAVVSATIFTAVISLAKSAVKKPFEIIICLLAFVAVAFLKINPIIVIVISGIFGFFFFRLKKMRGKKDE